MSPLHFFFLFAKVADKKGGDLMLNQVIVVGRLTKDLAIRKTDSGKNVATLTLAVPRSFKNVEGEYETDFIDCVLWEEKANRTAEYCRKGDIVGVRGRIQTRKIETEEGNRYRLEVIAEKITFLTKKEATRPVEA